MTRAGGLSGIFWTLEKRGISLTLRGLGKPEKELPLGKGRRPELAGDSESKRTKDAKMKNVSHRVRGEKMG